MDAAGDEMAMWLLALPSHPDDPQRAHHASSSAAQNSNRGASELLACGVFVQERQIES
jgi:hypothetical protein